MDFPDSSVDKESACSAGDLVLIPGSERSAGEAIGFPLQYSWSSLVAQLVKNPPTMWKTWVRSLGWEDPLEKGGEGKGYPLQYSGLVNSMDWRNPLGSQRVRHDSATLTFNHLKKSSVSRGICDYKVYLSRTSKWSESHSAVSESLCPAWTVARQAPLSMEFSMQGYWSGRPFPSPRDISDPGMDELGSSTLQAVSLPIESPGLYFSLTNKMSLRHFSNDNLKWFQFRFWLLYLSHCVRYSCLHR